MPESPSTLFVRILGLISQCPKKTHEPVQHQSRNNAIFTAIVTCRFIWRRPSDVIDSDVKDQ